jgi:hypothetical protein
MHRLNSLGAVIALPERVKTRLCRAMEETGVAARQIHRPPSAEEAIRDSPGAARGSRGVVARASAAVEAGSLAATWPRAAPAVGPRAGSSLGPGDGIRGRGARLQPASRRRQPRAASAPAARRQVTPRRGHARPPSPCGRQPPRHGPRGLLCRRHARGLRQLVSLAMEEARGACRRARTSGERAVQATATAEEAVRESGDEGNGTRQAGQMAAAARRPCVSREGLEMWGTEGSDTRRATVAELTVSVPFFWAGWCQSL